MGVVNFTEQIRGVQLIDFLVYVCGVEISPYIKSMEVSHSDRGGIGSVSLVLANPFDQWILTEQNLRGQFRRSKDRYSEDPKARIYYKKKAFSNLRIKPKQNNPQKGTGLQYDGDDKSNIDPVVDTLVASNLLDRYTFGPGTCVFSKLDPIRIFLKNPSDSSDKNRWVPFYTGTIDTRPFTTDFVSGESSIMIGSYDVRGAMQGMRVSLNPYPNTIMQAGAPGVAGSNPSVITFNSDDVGFFKDYYPSLTQSNSAFSNVFAGKRFVDAVSLIVTGQTEWVNSNKLTVTKEGTGIGSFEPGEVIRYLPAGARRSVKSPNTERTLEKWDNLCLFGESKTWWSEAKCRQWGEGSFYDGKFHPFVGKMHFLLPDSSLDISTMLDSNFDGVNGIMANPDWTDRYTLLSQICSNIDYQWGVTGAGDIIFEFPMYDLRPENFGSNSTIYIADRHVLRENISDEGGEVLAGLESSSVSANIGERDAQQQVNETERLLGVSNMRKVVFSNTLAWKYGAKIHHVSFTGVSTPEALARLTLIEFQKRLAEANKLSLDIIFRPMLRPNRPLLYNEPKRNRLGKTTNVSFGFSMFTEPTMSVGIGCVRTPIMQTDASGKRTIQYQHIAGGIGMALSYNELLEGPFPLGNPDSGLTVRDASNPTTGPGSGTTSTTGGVVRAE